MSEIITFGKYKSHCIETVPDRYLEWLINNFGINKWSHLAKLELDRRDKLGIYVEDFDYEAFLDWRDV